ncbi:MAG: hypothetical protein ABIL15_02895 [candidate division WOR-3 bacterium]
MNTMAEEIKREGNRLYTLNEIKIILRRAGFDSFTIYDGYNLPPERYKKSCKSSSIIITAGK